MGVILILVLILLIWRGGKNKQKKRRRRTYISKNVCSSLTANLVVADVSRTDKTICLAVLPSMKAYGLGGRARLFEVVEKMRLPSPATRKPLRKHGRSIKRR